MLFRNLNNLNRLFKELDSFDMFFDPNFVNGKEKMESGSDENGEWTKKTFKSSDGLYQMSYFTKNYNKPNELETLKKQLDSAVLNQDFELAVELRDKIKVIENNKLELDKLNKELSECVKKQDYEEAIIIRDKIKELK
jgi:excinuclease UvrABC helicase subunit UvrB